MENKLSSKPTITSQFNSKCLSVFRFFCFAIMLAHWLLYFVENPPLEVLIHTTQYLTRWTLLMTTVYFGVATFASPDSWTGKTLLPVFNHLVLSTNIMITIFFFSMLYTPAHTLTVNSYLNILNHCLGGILGIIEFCMNDHRVFFRTVPKLFIYPVIYFVHLCIWTFVSGEAVYKTFTFKDISTLYNILMAFTLFFFTSCMVILIEMVFKNKKFDLKKTDEDTKDLAVELSEKGSESDHKNQDSEAQKKDIESQ